MPAPTPIAGRRVEYALGWGAIAVCPQSLVFNPVAVARQACSLGASGRSAAAAHALAEGQVETRSTPPRSPEEIRILAESFDASRRAVALNPLGPLAPMIYVNHAASLYQLERFSERNIPLGLPLATLEEALVLLANAPKANR